MYSTYPHIIAEIMSFLVYFVADDNECQIPGKCVSSIHPQFILSPVGPGVYMLILDKNKLSKLLLSLRASVYGCFSRGGSSQRCVTPF